MNLSGSVRSTAMAGSKCPYVTLRQLPRARLRIRATNSLTAEPIKSADSQFRFSAERSWRGQTDGRGELLVPPNSELEVQIGTVGFENSEILKITSPQPGKVREVAVALRPLQTGCVTGTVVDQQGTPIAGARIQAGPGGENFDPGTWKSTDAKGHFRIDGVQPGNLPIYTYAEGYPLPTSQKDSSFTEVTVGSRSECAETNIKLGPKAAKLWVKVVDIVTQKPVKDAEVWAAGNFADGGTWSQKIAADPTPVPALTQFFVRASAEGYVKPQPMTILPMQPEQTQEITIALQPEGLQSAR